MPRDYAGRSYLQIGNLRVYVGSDQECEDATIAVCGNVSFFPDDVRATCSSCGVPIVHRPHIPQRPPKVCMACAEVIMRRDRYQ